LQINIFQPILNSNHFEILKTFLWEKKIKYL